MRFILEIKAPNSCRAKTIAKDKIARWSQENDKTVYLKNIRSGTMSNDRKKVVVTAEVEGVEDTIYL